MLKSYIGYGTLTIGVLLFRVGYQRAVISEVFYTVIVVIRVTDVAQSVAVCIELVGIGVIGAVIQVVLDAIRVTAVQIE